MDSGRIGGIVILLVLIASIGLAGYSACMSPSDSSSGIANNFSYTQAQLNGSNQSNISAVNLNINQKSGSADIKFADSDKIYDIQSEDTNNSTVVSHGINDRGELDVNVSSGTADNEIVLSNRYTYNINGEIIAGGLNANVSPNAKINNMVFNITTGGVDIMLNGGILSNAYINVAVGGINIQGTPQGLSTVNSNVTVGGVSVQLDKPVGNINSHVDLGGSQISNVSGSMDSQYTGTQYPTSDNKLNLHSYIRVGGFYSM